MTDTEFRTLLLKRWESATKLMATHPRVQEIMKEMDVIEEIHLLCRLNDFLSNEDKLDLMRRIEQSAPGFLLHLLENPVPPRCQ